MQGDRFGMRAKVLDEFDYRSPIRKKARALHPQSCNRCTSLSNIFFIFHCIRINSHLLRFEFKDESDHIRYASGTSQLNRRFRLRRDATLKNTEASRLSFRLRIFIRMIVRVGKAFYFDDL